MDRTEYDTKSEDAAGDRLPPGSTDDPAKRNPPEAFGKPRASKNLKGDPKSKDAGEGSETTAKEQAQDQDKPKEPQKPPFYKRPLLMTIIGVVALILIVGGILYWLHARQFESTDDAFIDGHIIPMSPKVAAIVKTVRIDDNWRVKAGQVLVELDPRDYQVALDQARAAESSARGKLARAQTQLPVAKANVGEVQAAVEVARTNAENANRDFQRIMSLDPRARSQQQVDNATAAQRSTAAQVREAESKLAAAEAGVADSEQAIKTAQADAERATADVHQAEINLGYCTIVAPEDGTITRKNVEPGQYLQVGQPLFSIVQPDVWVTANFKETQLDLMRIGQAVDISVDAFPGKDFHGKIDSFQAGTGSRLSLLPAENATGNYVKVVQRVPVKITFDGSTNEGARLLAPGMSVEPKVRVR